MTFPVVNNACFGFAHWTGKETPCSPCNVTDASMFNNTTDLPLTDAGVSLDYFGLAMVTYGPPGSAISSTGCGGNPCYSLSPSASFVDSTANWALGAGSPLHASGTVYNNTFPAFTLTNFNPWMTNATDVLGTARPQNGHFDVGAFQLPVAGGGVGGRLLLR